MKNTLSYIFATLLFNTAIAGVLTILKPDITFWTNFIFSQCIGFTILLINLASVAKIRSNVGKAAVLSLSLPISVAMGVMLGFLVTGFGGGDETHLWQSMIVGLFFGFIGVIAVLFYQRIEAEVQQRQLIKSESERREVEAHLKLLQAQIEPHFLFNTLANVGSLIDSDPALAKILLERLNDWLRVALARARSDNTTLGDELDMLENYLQILKIRFGERLRWRIEVPEEARRSAFPPMLLQPLVENAVRHGIEPKLDGGEIGIRASLENASLRIEVRDSGVGLQDTNGTGTGLTNVRARLATLFGTAGRLTLHGNTGGVVAMLELPG